MNNLQFFLVMNLTIFLAEGLNDCRRHKRESNQHQCELSPQSYEGPLYVAEDVLRSNITEYRPGVPFRLTLQFTNAKTCSPIPALLIQIWQCDAVGYYSHNTRFDPSVTFPVDDVNHAQPTDGFRFLRGAQITDRDGQVVFDTLLPG